MATGQDPIRQPDFTLLVDYARQTGSVRRLMEALGPKEALEALGPEEFWGGLSPQQQEELLRVARRDNSSESSNPS